MPELPEVETIRRDLQARLPGLIINKVTVLLPKIIISGPKKFDRVVSGATIVRVERRAKLLFLHLKTKQGPRVLLIHLKMTGQLVLTQKKDKVFGGHIIAGVTSVPNRYTHVFFEFSNDDVLYFNDLRQFGYLKLVTEPEAQSIAAAYGLEPLDAGFTAKAFLEICKRRENKKVKALLLDQTSVAGIGNIYADEACFRARVNPARRIGEISLAKKRSLWRAIRFVLALSVKHRGTTFSTYVSVDGQAGNFWRYRQVYGRKGEPCNRCGAILNKTVVVGRGTVWCSTCQR